MKEKKWHRVLAVFFVMVTVLSLLSGCGGKSAEKEDAETITVYLWSTSLYEKYAPYIQKNSLKVFSWNRKKQKDNGSSPDQQRIKLDNRAFIDP